MSRDLRIMQTFGNEIIVNDVFNNAYTRIAVISRWTGDVTWYKKAYRSSENINSRNLDEYKGTVKEVIERIASPYKKRFDLLSDVRENFVNNRDFYLFLDQVERSMVCKMEVVNKIRGMNERFSNTSIGGVIDLNCDKANVEVTVVRFNNEIKMAYEHFYVDSLNVAE